MSSTYLQSLTSYLYDKDLLSDELKAALLEHDAQLQSKPPVKMPFGKHKGMTLREIHAYKPNYIEWLIKQSYIKEKFTDIFEECVSLLESPLNISKI